MNIVSAPNPVLFKKAAPVQAVDKHVEKLIEDMKKTLGEADNPKGIGLAAPQVGESLQIFIVRLEPTDPFLVFINPEITWTSKQMESDKDLMEGCLSVPQIWGPTKRHIQVKLKYQTQDEVWHEEKFEGLMAVVIQHETDHLNGILFTRRIIEQNGKLYRIEEEKGKQIFKEIELQ